MSAPEMPAFFEITDFENFLSTLRKALAPRLKEMDDEWKREGPAALVRADKLGIKIHSLGGNCPVQGYGTFEGEEFYFRARGDGWQFHVGPEDRRFEPGEYQFDGEYEGGPYDAGWMPRHVAINLICDAVLEYRDDRAERGQP